MNSFTSANRLSVKLNEAINANESELTTGTVPITSMMADTYYSKPAYNAISSSTVLTAAQAVGGLIYVSASATLTFPSAASIIAYKTNLEVGDVFTLNVVSGSGVTVTLDVHASGTLTGSSSIIQNTTRTVFVRMTNVSSGTEAYTVL